MTRYLWISFLVLGASSIAAADETCNSPYVGNLIKGHALLLVDHGNVLRDAMLKSHISDHDLDEELRLRGVQGVQDVRYAYKERNGEVSVIKRKKAPRILDIAVQQGVQTVRLEVQGG